MCCTFLPRVRPMVVRGLKFWAVQNFLPCLKPFQFFPASCHFYKLIVVWPGLYTWFIHYITPPFLKFEPPGLGHFQLRWQASTQASPCYHCNQYKCGDQSPVAYSRAQWLNHGTIKCLLERFKYPIMLPCNFPTVSKLFSSLHAYSFLRNLHTIHIIQAHLSV